MRPDKDRIAEYNRNYYLKHRKARVCPSCSSCAPEDVPVDRRKRERPLRNLIVRHEPVLVRFD